MAITWSEADQERVLGRLAAIVSELPGTVVCAGHTDTGYLRDGHRFAWLLADPNRNGRLELWIEAPRGEPEVVASADPGRYFVAPYVGSDGWVGALVLPEFAPDWDEITALLEQAWRVGARAVHAFDQSGGTSR